MYLHNIVVKSLFCLIFTINDLATKICEIVQSLARNKKYIKTPIKPKRKDIANN